jgi:hypothetical protein
MGGGKRLGELGGEAVALLLALPVALVFDFHLKPRPQPDFRLGGSIPLPAVAELAADKGEAPNSGPAGAEARLAAFDSSD